MRAAGPDSTSEPSRFALNGGEPVDCDGYRTVRRRDGAVRLRCRRAGPVLRVSRIHLCGHGSRPGVGLRVDEISVDTDAGETIGKHAVLGEAIPGMEVRFNPVDGHANDIADREVGEIEIRGTSMMSGYLGEEPIDTESWFPTGDIGYFVDGGLVVCGRAKELITVAGRNVFPTEIERVAAQVHGVRDGAVVAVGTGEGSVRPGLVIAAEFKGDDEPAARSALVQKIASECGVVPSDVVFLKPGSLPRTSSGKLRRLEVKRNLETVSP